MKHIPILFVVAALFAVSCKQAEPPVIAVQSVAIDQAAQTLKVGQTLQLSATVLPENADDKTVRWTSSDEDVVMVSSDSRAKAVGEGTAEVRAESGDKSASITLTVVAADAVEAPSPSVTVGAERISPVSAVLKGKANLESPSTEVSAGFQYAAKSVVELPFGSTGVAAVEADADYNYSAVIAGLEPGVTYQYRSVLKVGEEEFYGEVKEFTTSEIGTLFATADAADKQVGQITADLTASLDIADVVCEEITYGFIWGMAEDALTNIVVARQIGDNAFGATITGLSYKTKYYYKAFVIINGRTYYGTVKSLTTQPYGADAVDLGLSVKWANKNIGADYPEQWGDFYAWGELEPYYDKGQAAFAIPIWRPGKTTGYSWESYKWAIKVDEWMCTFTKYCLSTQPEYWSGDGDPDGKTELDPEDDVAHVVLGGEWRMPTYEECLELKESCTWKVTKRNGVTGVLVTGPNENSIFFPATGERYDTVLEEGDGHDVWCWSSSLDKKWNSSSSAMYICYDYHGYPIVSAAGRPNGFTVRAVIK